MLYDDRKIHVYSKPEFIKRHQVNKKPTSLSLRLISQYLFAASYHCGTSYASMYDCINADMFIHFNFNHGIVDSN